MESDLSSSYLINGDVDSSNTSMLSLLLADDEPSPPPQPPPMQHCSSSSFLSPDFNNFLLPPLPETLVSPKPESPLYGSPPMIPPLPDLLSLENFPHAAARPEQGSGENKNSYSLESILDDYFISKQQQQQQSKKKKSIKKFNHHHPAAKKMTLSEKAYCLWKILPGDNHHYKRRNTVEMLEDTHKYIRFLQAQVSALRSMPAESAIGGCGGGSCGGGGGGTAVLRRMNRQQVLEVVVNSPVAQAVMAENGWCVMAAEQVAMINKIEARKKLVHRLLANLPL